MPTTTGKIYLGSTLIAGGGEGGGEGGWTRPADWPALPVVAASDQVFHGLYAVFDHESNFATIRCTGAFTVDWGDGSAPVNVASNTTAEYNYSYAASGLGSVTSRGYKTAIVTVTPQEGETLSEINLGQKHTQPGLVVDHSSQWLDIRLAMNNVGTVKTLDNDPWYHRLLEQFEWVGGSSTQTNFSGFLSFCYNLQSVPLFDTSAGENFSDFLTSCHSLQSVPLLDTSAGENFSGFLASCYSLQSVPLFDTSAGENFSGFLTSCFNLQSVPLYDTSAGENFSGFLASCHSLQSVPLYDTSAGENFSDFLTSCYSLQSVPLFDTSAGTDFNYFLSFCNSLQSVPLLDTSAGESFSGFLAFCHSVSRIQATFPADQNLNLGNLALGPAALDEIYTDLPIASGSPVITVTGNWGTSSHDSTIATDKGWTVIES